MVSLHFQLDLPSACSKRQHHALVKSMLAKASHALSAKDNVRCERRIYISLTGKDGHTYHDFGLALDYGQPINKEVAEKLKALVREGVTSVNEVQQCLRFYVEDVMFLNTPAPKETCRAFFPTREDIRSHIKATIRKDRMSSIDQENAGNLLGEEKLKDPKANIFFRPFQHVPSDDASNSLDPEDVLDETRMEFTNTLLFCYQSEFMKKLLQKYGDEEIFLDATNKTTDYSLPLFFLVAKPATEYAVVGAFIVQFETSECIAEALSIFKDWCPSWRPKYWMVDYSLAEMNAIKLTFPESLLALCEFHRKQAWRRWCSKKDNGVGDQNTVLSLLNQVADSTSEEDFEISLRRLKDSDIWQSNPKLQLYIQQKWLSVKELWVRAYRLDLLHFTNNGTETQNKMLKEHFLKRSNGRRSLTGLIQVLLQKFFVQKREDYIRRNVCFTSEYRLYHSSVPSYLHNRPPPVIRHVLQRLSSAAEFGPEDVCQDSQEGVFHVKSETSGEVQYKVDFHVPSCECRDFQKTRLPCKHFCAVFQLMECWNFDSLPHHYKNGPIMTLDVTAADTVATTAGREDIDEHSDVASFGPSHLAELEKKRRRTIGRARQQLLSKLEMCQSLAYYCTNIEEIEAACDLADECKRRLQDGTPSTAGIVQRNSPTKGCSGSRKRSTTQSQKE